MAFTNHHSHSSFPFLQKATLADFLAIPENNRFHELIAGHLIQKASPSGKHGGIQFRISAFLGRYYDRKPGGKHPGGWWFAPETEIEFSTGDILRPDLSGWKRENLPTLPAKIPVYTQPDWVCEILSPSNASTDLVKKKQIYEEASIPHYWIIDPEEENITIHRLTSKGYKRVLQAKRGEAIYPEPFLAVEVNTGTFFGDDDEE